MTDGKRVQLRWKTFALRMTQTTSPTATTFHAPLPTAPLPERLPYLLVERALRMPPPVRISNSNRTNSTAHGTVSTSFLGAESPPPVDTPPEPTLAPPTVVTTGRPQREKFPSLKLQEQQQGLASARIIGEDMPL
jgi:hypothetical protein